jgi:hypothetical protein
MLQKLPIGIQTFSKIREEAYLYVDKTEIIYRLITSGGYFFLSRHRRFGKSLTLSTIKALYSGQRELFHGLKYAADPHPKVLIGINFSSEKKTVDEWVAETVA